MDSEHFRQLTDWQPTEWLVVFQRGTSRTWLSRLIPGRYKHVAAFARFRKTGVWLFVDHLVSRTQMVVIDDERADFLLAQYTQGSLVVQMPAPVLPDMRLAWRPVFSCVSTVAHILGLRTCALRPDALLRQCLARNGTIVVDDRHENAPGRSRAEAPATGSRGGEDRGDP